MLKMLMISSALIMLATVAATAQASSQSASDASAIRSAKLVQLALNPQPEPPGACQKAKCPKKKKIKKEDTGTTG
jgi:hypothetical protein